MSAIGSIADILLLAVGHSSADNPLTVQKVPRARMKKSPAEPKSDGAFL